MNSSKKKKNSVFILTVYITNQLDFRYPGILIAFAILMRSISVNESILNEYTILPSWSLGPPTWALWKILPLCLKSTMALRIMIPDCSASPLGGESEAAGWPPRT